MQVKLSQVFLLMVQALCLLKQHANFDCGVIGGQSRGRCYYLSLLLLPTTLRLMARHMQRQDRSRVALHTIGSI